jgi:hypothetical protein
MSDVPPPASSKSAIDWGAVIHAVAGLAAVILGALMYFKPWARDLFSILMIVAAIAAIYFSWKHSAWVPGHWFAMLPVVGVMLGYLGWQWGFSLAYAMACFCPFYYSWATKLTSHIDLAVT